jgi:hypothetical protein
MQIRHSLNAEDAATLGGAYFSALKAGTIVGSKLEVRKPSFFDLNTSFDDTSKPVFSEGESIKEKKVQMIGNVSRLI